MYFKYSTTLQPVIDWSLCYFYVIVATPDCGLRHPITTIGPNVYYYNRLFTFMQLVIQIKKSPKWGIFSDLLFN